MTGTHGFRLPPSGLPSIVREPRGTWDGQPDRDPTDGGVVAFDEAACLIDRLARVLDDTTAYEAATAGVLRAHRADLRRLTGVVAAASAHADAAYVAVGGLQDDGVPSLSALRQREGMTSADAAKASRLANGIGDAHATATALAAGEITADAATEVIRARDNDRLGDDPDRVEADLLRTTKSGNASKVRTRVKHMEQTRDGDRLRNDAARQHKLRKVSLTEQRDGMWSLHGLLPAEDGERAKTLLDALSTWDAADTPESEKRTTGQRTADAFTDAVDWMLDHRDLPVSNGRNRPHVVVTVPSDTVHTEAPTSPSDDRWADLPPGEYAWADHPVAPQTVRRICCDAQLTHVIIDDNGMPLSVGRATRTWTGSQRTAITVRDGGCRGPGCDRPAGWTEIHHVQWWRHGGETDIDNGLLLCRHCHRLVHDHGWQLDFDPTTAEATWTSPSGRVTTTSPRSLDQRRRRRDTA